MTERDRGRKRAGIKVLPKTRRRVTGAVDRRLRRLAYKLAGPRAAEEPPPIEGLVEDFTKRKISGWLALPLDAPPVRVRLMLNDLEVAAAWATTPRRDRTTHAGEARRFDLRLRDVWAYARPRDRFRVLAEDRALAIVGHGTELAPERKGKHALPALRAKMSTGHVFGQTGRLQLSKKHDHAWQASVMGLYQEIRDIVAHVLGYDLFLFYGTLLGAVREGTVIGHDVDFDAAYVSALTHPRAAALELQALGLLLVDRGYHLRCTHTSLHIYSRDGSGARIDVFHTYFDAQDVLCLPFGVAGTIDVTAAQWNGTTEIAFCGGRALLPANSAQMAELLYGSGWRSPQPGFDWSRERTRRDWRGVLTLIDVQDVYWADFYAHHQIEGGSTFFEAVSEHPELPATVIDLGCGDGRDSLAFAAAGRTVIGLDRSTVGIRNAAQRAEELGLSDRASFATCDFSYSDRLAAELRTILRSTEGSLLFYLRFVLHAIPADGQEILLTVIADAARPGDLLAAEFRTDRDENQPKTYGGHFRRFQHGLAFGRDLSDRFGFSVLSEHEGIGLSPYQDENPELYRVVARKR